MRPLKASRPFFLSASGTFLIDASPATREKGWVLLEKELESLPVDGPREIVAGYLERIKAGERDLYL